MARVTIEDCLVRVSNRYSLVHIAAKRVRQMREGAQYLVHSPKNEDIVVSLREIAAGKTRVRQMALPDAAEEMEAIEMAAEETE